MSTYVAVVCGVRECRVYECGVRVCALLIYLHLSALKPPSYRHIGVCEGARFERCDFVEQNFVFPGVAGAAVRGGPAAGQGAAGRCCLYIYIYIYMRFRRAKVCFS